ncbi:hypothetical protein LCGC14_1345940 [marine sediment metagenome]|uniref:Uncharacterized protein n=1 Tax=marine sediment metagenome TaxID=412755 RepID=A0A0F9KCZ8_9ZZZZ
MVAIVKHKIYTDMSQAEEFAEDFKNELRGMLEQVAKDYKCNVEDLKFTVNNLGVVNIQSMTPLERNMIEAERQHKKQVNIIRKIKGLSNG